MAQSDGEKKALGGETNRTERTQDRAGHNRQCLLDKSGSDTARVVHSSDKVTPVLIITADLGKN